MTKHLSNLKTILLLLFMMSGSGFLINANAQACRADFMYEINGTNVQFSDSSFMQYRGNYSWSFGDGTGGSGPFKMHNYQRPGNYNVCLIIRDTVNQCIDSVCKNIVIANCKAAFGLQQTNNSVKFNNYSSDLGARFHWNFGDGITSKQTNPTHAYTQTGTFYISLNMYDSVNNCTDSIVHWVMIQNVPVNCKADFSHSSTGLDAEFIADTTNSTSKTTYFWDFGDSSFSKDTNPKHAYKDTGTYQVCLTVTDGNCNDKKCYNVVISQPSFSINGSVFTDNVSTDQGNIYLIRFDAQDSTLTAIDSMAFQTLDSAGGHYSFRGVKPGTYLLKAALSAGSVNYSAYLPTYCDSSLKWSGAREITVTNRNEWAYIYMKKGSNPGGKGFISGKVSQGANKAEGDPLQNIQVMLFDADLQAVTYTYTDADGNFSFSNLALGRYQVYTEVPGLLTVPGWVELTEENPELETIAIRISAKKVEMEIITRIETTTATDVKVSVFPNPVQEQLNVSIDAVTAKGANLVIYDYLGRQVISQSIAPTSHSQTININTSQLPAGVYLMQLQFNNNDQTRQFKFIK